MKSPRDIADHVAELKRCARCTKMLGPVVTSRPVHSEILLIGQAPGPHEGELGQPFAWTAGKTLFRWFATIGVEEETFRSRVYMSAVCRCFPGKTKEGADRVPTPDEIETCARWLQAEVDLLRPRLAIAVGRLAIERFLPKAPLAEIVGRLYRVTAFGHEFDLLPLPHPSGASTWFKKDPGKTLLLKALRLLADQPTWRKLRGS